MAVHVSGLRFDINVTYILQVHRFKVESANWLSLHFNLHLHSSVHWWHYICPYSKLSILRLLHEDLAASFRSCQIFLCATISTVGKLTSTQIFHLPAS